MERRPDSRGKVRDIYDAGENLLMVATDRISAFDFILPDEIPFKGEVLNRISAFWFDKFADIVPNHLVSIDPADFPEEFAEYRDYLAGRAMLVKKAQTIPIECIVRGYLTGSGKKTYDEKGRLIDQVVTDEVEYMTADVEDEYVVAQANEPLDEGKHFIRPRVSARRRDDILEIDAEKVDYMDVSPRMMVSVATACIPFLENDDCNRALMGSNMQRQAVPLMVTQQPIVATGMEYKAATDSGTAVLAKNDGVVEKMDADHVVVRNEQGTLDNYSLIKFARSNAGTCINQRPIVEVGETVKISYVDQNRSGIDPDKNLWEVVSDGLDHMMVGETEVPSRAYVASFGFKGQDQQKRAGVLSGGERNRLNLALTLKQGGNLLLLDEPTNDLDVETLSSLEAALLEFPGCSVVISHDRMFLDRVATHILAWEGTDENPGNWYWFEGNFEAYQANRIERLGEDAAQPHRIHRKLTRD